MLPIILLSIGMFLSAFYIGHLRNLVKKERNRGDQFKGDYLTESSICKQQNNQIEDQRRAIRQLQRDIQDLTPNIPNTKTKSKKKKTIPETINKLPAPDIEIFEE